MVSSLKSDLLLGVGVLSGLDGAVGFGSSGLSSPELPLPGSSVTQLPLEPHKFPAVSCSSLARLNTSGSGTGRVARCRSDKRSDHKSGHECRECIRFPGIKRPGFLS